jgi:hypothetical protein
MSIRNSTNRRGWRWVYLLFVIQFAVALWPPLYNRVEPSLYGMPFFYWFQLGWVIVSAVFTAIVYFATDSTPKNPAPTDL